MITPLLDVQESGTFLEQRASPERVLDSPLFPDSGIIVSSPLMLIIAIAVDAVYDGRSGILSPGSSYISREKGVRIRKIPKHVLWIPRRNGARPLRPSIDSAITPVGHVLRNLHLDGVFPS